MNSRSHFTTGNAENAAPEGDAARQAVASLKGYAYQILASALAWVDTGQNEHVYLEVAEDYARVTRDHLSAVQVKDTAASGSITLNNNNVHDAITSFVDLVARNQNATVSLRYLTTSEIGTEKALDDRPGGIAGLEYWRKAAMGADVTPLRTILDSDAFPASVREYVRARDDVALRTELLQRIKWDAGQPDFTALREELVERLIVIGRDRFSLPAEAARQFADVLAFHVLRKSILTDTAKRVLKRAELYELIDEVAQVSVPQAAFNAMISQFAGLTGAVAGGVGQATALAVSDPGWLITSRTMITPSRFIQRPAVQNAVAEAINTTGAVILFGATGLGKSHMARVAAEARADVFAMIDLRDADAAETRQRLDIAFGRIGGLDASLIIFEDLNHLDDPSVARALSRVMAAIRRRDRVALLTCYSPPGNRALTTAGLEPRCIVGCPYFSEEETQSLVHLYDGDAKLWGPLAHVAGAGGHPQLTHAFIVGLAARGWPREEISSIIMRGLTSGDIDAEKEAARRALISALPENARGLLYRLSFLIGRFSRSTALTLADTPPPIAQAGEAMDLLIGPWVEALGADQYRVSPLAGGAGRNMLSANEQQRLHDAIATNMLSSGTVNASDFDSLFMHALLGKSALSLFRLSMSVISMQSEKLAALAENTNVLPLLDPGMSPYPDEPSIAVMIRAAQFKILSATPDKSKINAVAAAAMRDVAQISNGQLKKVLEILVRSAVLTTLNVADYFDEWLAWLQAWKLAMASPGIGSEVHAAFEGTAEASGAASDAMLFSLGTGRLSTVARLEKIIDDLAALAPADRANWLSPANPLGADFSVLINGPWAAQEKADGFDAAAAADAYARIAEKTRDWGISALAIQPWIARATLLDEQLNDSDGALAVLDEAAERLGTDQLITRARAKIFWRRGDHPTALQIMRGIADTVGADNPVERAFAMRQAAISAANCGDWKQAEAWFGDAQVAADASQTDDMRHMAIGLGADAAAAALRQGHFAVALDGFAVALKAMNGVDPEASLRAAYLHRVVRHAILWAKAVCEDEAVDIGGSPIDVPPGSCSNPDPVESIRELPLSAIDTAWYLLAECEIASGIDVGIVQSLPQVLTDGQIPVLEMSLSNSILRRSIELTDHALFADNLERFVRDGLFVNTRLDELKTSFTAVSPPRGTITPADLQSEIVEQLACDAILAFGLRAVYANRTGSMAQLQAELRRQQGDDHAGHTVFAPIATGIAPDLARTVKTIIDAYFNGIAPDPTEIWRNGFRFFEQHSRSPFGQMLFPYCAQWLRQEWTRTLHTQRFLLVQPMRTVPPIMEVLDNKVDNKAFAAALLLAAINATGVRLAPAYVAELQAAARSESNNKQSG
ncbi:hypothetical protein [Methylobacterium sp. J-076]|uniref:hypothetical protein n=1 Tax=Methylobacterium sp. J-076 TaxID=2836655 RepID=UPI001FB9706B|nr:hypothetical protein [Methylobacterium sp. J-076]MCJ2012430.1 hypothetical protein [Methylobacterium sp. J-076]